MAIPGSVEVYTSHTSGVAYRVSIELTWSAVVPHSLGWKPVSYPDLRPIPERLRRKLGLRKDFGARGRINLPKLYYPRK